MGVFDVARQLAEAGINVIPAVYQDKKPAMQSWEKYQQEQVPFLQIEKWFGKNARRNLLVVCGRVSRLLVLDLDNKEAGVWWRLFPGMAETMDATTCVKTSKGYHFWFRLEDGETFQSIQMKDEDRRWDIRCEGGLVIGPGSVHESGKEYRWVRDLSYIQPVPNAVRAWYEQRSNDDSDIVRSLFVDLISNAPEAEGDGRNDWLARVAGHLAKWIPHKDAYEAMVYFVNNALEQPLDEEEEVDKLVRSIWKGHQQRHMLEESERPASAETGWLEGNGWQMFTTVKVGEDEALAPWVDFDIRVLGVVKDVEDRSYRIELRKNRDQSTEELLVPAETLTNPQMLARWCGNHGLSFLTPPGDKWGRLKRTDRIHNYVVSQQAPECTVVNNLGWTDGVGFITHEGLLTRSGVIEHEGLVPHPKLVQWAPYRYGFVPENEAIEVLQEVMTFHDETVTAVFGSWWAACWLKAQVMAKTALFPFMALEAASESGKTTGFFSLMVQLNGNAMGHGEYTAAALRDYASAHRNGIVWVDDMSDPAVVMDLLRQTTAEGSRAKKGQDKTGQESVQLLAPVVISGEGFDALSTEKALRDRAVILDVPSPTGRMSAKHPERPQWDDILELKGRYGGDLTKVAGTLGGMALECGDLVDGIEGLRVGKGRWGDKMAVLRMGAQVLQRLTGEERWPTLVDQWTLGINDPGAENLLTTAILPRLLADYGMPTSAKGNMPVFVDKDGLVWFHEGAVASAWERVARTPRERQLGQIEAIRSQRHALGIVGIGRRLRTGQTGDGRYTWGGYHCVGEAVSHAVLSRRDLGASLPGSHDENPDTLL